MVPSKFFMISLAFLVFPMFFTTASPPWPDIITDPKVVEEALLEMNQDSWKDQCWLVVLNMFYFHPYLGK